MPEFLQSLEPYASYRFALGLVLGGLTLYFVVAGLITLRQATGLLDDLNAMAARGRILDDARRAIDPGCELASRPPLKARPGRVIKLLVLAAALRMLRPRSLAGLAPELAAVALLAAANVWALAYVFA